MDFNKIVKRMWNTCWKVFLKKDIYDLIDPERKVEYASVVNKTIYRLKAQWVIISLKAGIYVVPEAGDSDLNSVDLMDKYYFRLIKKIITKEVLNNYYVSGIQSLQYHMKNFEVPDKIFIVNRTLRKKVMIGKKELIFKTISWNHNDGKKQSLNLYSLLAKHTVSKSIDGVTIRCSCLELSLLESALVSDSEVWVDIWLISKAIKKYSSVFSCDVFHEVWRYKYIMSFNRLKELSKSLDKDFSKLCLEVIKKNGNLFIWEWNRGI